MKGRGGRREVTSDGGKKKETEPKGKLTTTGQGEGVLERKGNNRGQKK